MNNQTTTTNEATDRKKLYSVKTRYDDIGTITEYVVIKETPKTYVAARATDPSGRWSTRTVKKADPQVFDEYFCVGYYEALLYKKQLFERKIAFNENEIKRIIRKNVVYDAELGNTLANIAALSAAE